MPPWVMSVLWIRKPGEIYKIDNGFTDWYDGSRYKAISDDQYTDSVEAIIHWK